jgi:mRNA degradation ribonuclease J1/J2
MSNLNITPIGGVGKVGQNCFLYTFKMDGKVYAFLIDAGTEIIRDKQDEDEGYVDMELLDYMLANKGVDVILGIFLTHGHLDHSASAGKVSRRFNIPVYASKSASQFLLLQARNRAHVYLRDYFSDDVNLKRTLERQKSAGAISLEEEKELEHVKAFLDEKRSEFIKKECLPENLLYVIEDGEGKVWENTARSTYILERFEPFCHGGLTITPIPFLHSLEALGFLIEFEGKRILHMPDCKLNGYNLDERCAFENTIKELVRQGKIDAVVMESLRASVPGESHYEVEVLRSLREIMRAELTEVVDGKRIIVREKRIIITTLASHIVRLKKLFAITKNLSKVSPIFPAFCGPSLIGGAKIAKLDTSVNSQDAQVLIVSGSQAEKSEDHESLLLRMLKPKRRRFDLEFQSGDVVIFAFSAIPGNETQVAELIHKLNKRGLKVYVNLGEKERLGLMDCENVFEALVHTTGHGYAGEKAEMLRLLNPATDDVDDSEDDSHQMAVIPYHAGDEDVVALAGLLPDNCWMNTVKVGRSFDF